MLSSHHKVYYFYFFSYKKKSTIYKNMNQKLKTLNLKLLNTKIFIHIQKVLFKDNKF